MTKIDGPARLPLFLLAALALVHLIVVLATVSERGIPWDEPPQRGYGQAVVEWYASGFSEEALEGLGNLILYGGMVEGPLELAVDLLPGDPFTIRHAMVGALATLGLIGVFVLGWQVAGPWVGLGAAFLLFAMPRYTGHGFFNSKDIPTAVFYLWTVVLLVRELRSDPFRPLRSTIPLGFCLGLLLGTRIGGGIIGLPMLAGFAAAWWIGDRGRRLGIRMAARLSAVCLLAWLVMLVGWPWAQQRPILGPLVALMANSRFPWESLELFQGEFISSLALPLSYVPVWLWQTTPEIVLVGLVLLLPAALLSGGAGRWREDLSVPVVLLAAIVPVAWVVVTRAALYDGPRHLLFVQPFLALGAATGVAWAVGRMPRRAKMGFGIVLGLAWLAPIVEMVRLHPYEYVYFNRIAGGLQGAEGRMELDYWGLSYREGAERFGEMALDPGPVRVASCSNPYSTSYFLSPEFEYLGSYRFEVSGQPDYSFYTALQDCLPGEPVGVPFHQVTRRGVPLLSIVRHADAGTP